MQSSDSCCMGLLKAGVDAAVSCALLLSRLHQCIAERRLTCARAVGGRPVCAADSGVS